MNQESLNLFIAVGECHRLLKEFAQRIRCDANVSGVAHWMDVINVGTSCRIEEYVDAELRSGEAISWRLELLISIDRFVIESDVRRIHKYGQDFVAEISKEVHSSADECAISLSEVANRLCKDVSGLI